MRGRVWLLLAVGVLAACTAGGTSPASSPTAPAPTLTPTATFPAGPSPTLPPTWTPTAPAQPAATAPVKPAGTRAPTTAAAAGGWPLGQLPAVTLTPTRMAQVEPAAEAAYRAAQVAWEAGRIDEALAAASRAVALMPAHGGYLALQGELLVASDHPLQGEEILRQALAVDPFQVEARRTLALLYVDYGRWRNAEDQLGLYLELAPADAEAWLALGKARERQARPAPAIEAYSAALALDPLNLTALGSRGALLYQSGELEAAYEDLSAALVLEPTAERYQLRASILLVWDEPALAAADLEAALALLGEDPARYELTMAAGQAWLDSGNGAQASLLYSQAISLTTSISPYLGLGTSYLVAGTPDAALEVFGQAMELAGPLEIGRVLLGLGRAHCELGEYPLAVEELGQALEGDLDLMRQAEAMGWRGMAQAGLGNWEAAIADLDAARQQDPRPVWLYRRGTVQMAAGDNEAARADLASYLEMADPAEEDPARLQDAADRLATLAEE